MTVKKADVAIEEKPKTPQEKIVEEVLKRLEVPVQPPPIEELLEKAKQIQAQAQKVIRKQHKHTWHCTDCGDSGIQITSNGRHFPVEVIDGEFCDKAGNPLTGIELSTMEHYAVPKVEAGTGHANSQNSQVLTAMKMDKVQK